MKINNLRFFDKPKLSMRLAALAILGTILITTLSACAPSGPSEEELNLLSKTKKKYTKGKHTVFVTLHEDPTEEIIAYEYHPGYKPEGIAIKNHGSSNAVFDKGCIMYVNTSEVVCTATGRDENNLFIFTDFGVPKDKATTFDNMPKDEVQKFIVDEHAISIPIDSDPTENSISIPSYDGYEAEDVIIKTHGASNAVFDSGCILYVNDEPVKCTATGFDDNDKPIFESIGTPLDKEAVKVLNKGNRG